MANNPGSDSTNVQNYTTAITNQDMTTRVFGINDLNNKWSLSFKNNCLEPYFSSIKRLAELHDISSSGEYISGVTMNKTAELNKITSLLSNNTRLTEQMYRADNYDFNSTLFYTAFIKYTLVLSSTLFIVASLTLTNTISTSSCFYISMIVIALFTLVLGLNIANNYARVPVDWGKYDWGGVSGITGGPGKPITTTAGATAANAATVTASKP